MPSQVAKLKRTKYRRPILQLRVRRPSLYHDSYAQLSIRNAEEMRGKLQIRYTPPTPHLHTRLLVQTSSSSAYQGLSALSPPP